MFKIFLAIILALACAKSSSHSGTHQIHAATSASDTTGFSGGDDGHVHP